MAASTSSSSFSPRIPRLLHDVFLSFRGDDTRNSFTSHLLEALNRQRFSTFRDDTNLQSGEDISSELLKAIEECRISIVVFSKNYAASKWCLDELVKIMECRRDFKQIVLPIFYDVDPSQVRSQLSSFSEAFAKHEDRVKEGRLSMERVERWRVALIEAANLSGHNLQHGDETKLIKEVVEGIVKRLDQLYFHVATHSVGIESRVQKLKELLHLGSDDVRIVAIWGVGGIGKTTIAKAIFNCIRNEFEGSSFLADVSEVTKKLSGVVKLQKQLLSNILTGDNYNLDSYHHGIEVIKQKLCHRRVLLIFDDVDHVEQLKMLAIDHDFFSSGSRVIITTRYMTSLTPLQVDSFYSPEVLNEDESLELFSWNAFKTDYPRESHQQISNEIVVYAEGLPLVLEVLGSFLKDRSIAEWHSELDKLKTIPNGDIQRKLKISFDSLDDKNQELCLDIAFFFIGRDKYFTVKVLEDSGCFPESGIGELARRCLVRVDDCGLLRMHNVLRDMSREIVRQQSLKEPGKRSRLWYREEVLQVLQDYTGTKAIEGLTLELPALNNVHVNTKAFANMSNLRLLHVNHLQHLSGTYITTSRKMTWICWDGFPLEHIHVALYMDNLVAIDLQYSKLKQMWKGSKSLEKLRFLKLSHSYDLTKTPNFSRMKSLEMLFLNDCTSLVKVHNSIGCLDKLLMLNMTNCKNLRSVPPSLFTLKSLEKLDFSGCSKLGEQAQGRGPLSMTSQWLTKRLKYKPISMASVQGLSCLRELNLAWCNMKYISNEIGSLITLERLNLSGNKFSSLPSSFSHLSRLKDLDVTNCVQLKSLVDLPNNLLKLKADNCISLETVSVGIDVHSEMHRSTIVALSSLVLSNCPKLDSKSLTNFYERNIQQVHQRRYTLSFPGGELPKDIEFQSIGSERLSFVVPPLVGKKITGLIICAALSEHDFSGFFEIESIAKGKGYPVWRVSEVGRLNGDHVVMIYLTTPEWKFNWEEGDELDLFFINLFPPPYQVVKRLGLSFIYEDDNNKYLQSNIDLLI